MIHLDSQKCFERAIASGRLQREDKAAKNYVGNYMYMGTWDVVGKPVDAFKDIFTRIYID